MHDNQQHLSFLQTVARLTETLESLDEMHSAISENTLTMQNAQGKAELLNTLREIVFVTNETITELEDRQIQPEFRVIKGGGRGNINKDNDIPDHTPERQSFQLLVGSEKISSPLYIMKQAGG